MLFNAKGTGCRWKIFPFCWKVDTWHPLSGRKVGNFNQWKLKTGLIAPMLRDHLEFCSARYWEISIISCVSGKFRLARQIRIGKSRSDMQYSWRPENKELFSDDTCRHLYSFAWQDPRANIKLFLKFLVGYRLTKLHLTIGLLLFHLGHQNFCEFLNFGS